MRAEGFSCSLDNGHPLWLPRDKSTAVFYQKISYFFTCKFFINFGHKNPGSGFGNPDTESMNPDPKHCFILNISSSDTHCYLNKQQRANLHLRL